MPALQSKAREGGHGRGEGTSLRGPLLRRGRHCLCLALRVSSHATACGGGIHLVLPCAPLGCVLQPAGGPRRVLLSVRAPCADTSRAPSGRANPTDRGPRQRHQDERHEHGGRRQGAGPPRQLCVPQAIFPALAITPCAGATASYWRRCQLAARQTAIIFTGNRRLNGVRHRSEASTLLAGFVRR